MISMRTLSRLAFAVAVAALFAAPAIAQRQPGPGRGGIGGLLMNESVQKELKIEKEQADMLREAVTKVMGAHKDAFAKLSDLGPDERRTKGQELNKIVTEETMKAVDGILQPKQLKRLKQIELQQAGAQAYSRAEIQKTLNLNDDQKEKIKSIADDTSKQMADLRGGVTSEERRDKIAKLRKETGEKVLAVLTDEQKNTWKEMTGEPFEVVRTRPGS
jgi:ATP-dependent exoDNAse (exonuclease V) beta subunit